MDNTMKVIPEIILGFEIILLAAVGLFSSLLILKIDNSCKFNVFYQSYKLLRGIFIFFKVMHNLGF